jgi:tetratricopeptide (TPR) repeat protein
MDENKVAAREARAPVPNESGAGRFFGLTGFIEKLAPGRVVLAVCVLSFLAYANSLAGDFVFDDLDQVVGNHDIRSWSNIERAFTTHLWSFRDRPEILRPAIPPPYYRPIFTVALTVEYQMFGLWPQGWHLVSLFLHIMCSIAVYYILLLISKRNAVAALSAALFAIYPVHVESVSWISGITDPLFGVFFLWSFYFYLRYRLGAGWKHLAVSLLLFLVATFSKETALSLVALVFAYELIESSCRGVEDRPGILKRLAVAGRFSLPFAGVVTLYLIARYTALGALTWKTGRTYEGPLIHTFYTLPSVVWTYLSHLIWPVDLSVVYFTSFVTSVASPKFLVPAIAFALMALLLVFYRRRISREVWHALVLSIVPLLPVLDLRQLSDEYLVFDRYLYVSVAGWSYLIALGIARLSLVGKDRNRAETPSRSMSTGAVISSAVGALLLIGLTAGTARENRSWVDGYSLWTQATRVRPQFWGGHYNQGLELMRAKRYSEALNSLRRAAQLGPNEPFVFDALGRAYKGMGDTENAVASFKHSIAMDPAMFESFNNLGTIYFEINNYAEAERHFLEALNLKPEAAPVRFNLGLCYERWGKYQEASRQFELVIEGAPRDAEAHYQLGLSYEKLGQTAAAIASLQRGLSQAGSQDLSDRISEALARLKK